jgi:hypothetical protein
MTQGNLRFGREAIMPTESTILNAPPRTTESTIEDVTLTDAEARRLIGICVELMDLCAKVTGKIDPAIGSIVSYARDEAFSQAPEFSS